MRFQPNALARGRARRGGRFGADGPFDAGIGLGHVHRASLLPSGQHHLRPGVHLPVDARSPPAPVRGRTRRKAPRCRPARGSARATRPGLVRDEVHPGQVRDRGLERCGRPGRVRRRRVLDAERPDRGPAQTASGARRTRARLPRRRPAPARTSRRRQTDAEVDARSPRTARPGRTRRRGSAAAAPPGLARARRLVQLAASHLHGRVRRRRLHRLADQRRHRGRELASSVDLDRAPSRVTSPSASSVSVSIAEPRRSPRRSSAGRRGSAAAAWPGPRRSASRPVAIGSSVPAWPTFRVPSARRTASTASCEVMPAGLSTRRSPRAAAVTPPRRLAAASAATEPLDRAGRPVPRRVAGGEPVPAAAERGRDGGDVVTAPRPHADLEPAVPLLLQRPRRRRPRAPCGSRRSGRRSPHGSPAGGVRGPPA